MKAYLREFFAIFGPGAMEKGVAIYDLRCGTREDRTRDSMVNSVIENQK
jgi:hypothetical protein